MALILRDTVHRPGFSGGSVTHTVCLARHLARLHPDFVVQTTSPDLYDGCRVKKIASIDTPFRLIKLARWLHRVATLDQHIGAADVVIFSSQLEPYARTTGKHIIVIHDIVPLIFGPRYNIHLYLYYKYYLGRVLHGIDAIVASSMSTKRDLIKYYDIEPDKIDVVHIGFADFPRTLAVASGHFLKQYGQYVLYVGSQLPHKNLNNLIKAFAMLNGSGYPLHLLIVGKSQPARLESLCEQTRICRVQDRVHFLGQLSVAELWEVYSGADMLVCPSLYEGFGMPPLEAMSVGTPTCVSRVSSLPEVCGEAALYFDPYDCGDMANVMEKCITDEETRRTLIEKGRARVKLFAWERVARQMLEVVARVADR